jgi:LEA14-like dessication related protein
MKKALLIFGGISLLGFGLYRYFKKQADILKDFTWKVSGFKLIKLTLNELSIDVSILFSSKADIEAKINKLYLDIYVEGKNVGFVQEVKSFIIPANGSTNIPLHISINPQSVFKNIFDVSLGVAKSKDLRLKLDGYANIRSGFISTTIPVVYETTIKEYLKGLVPTA